MNVSKTTISKTAISKTAIALRGKSGVLKAPLPAPERFVDLQYLKVAEIKSNGTAPPVIPLRANGN